MLSFLRKYRRGLFIGTITVFVVGTFVGLGGYLFTESDRSDMVAVVGKSKIPYQEYRLRVDRYLDALKEQGTEVTDALSNEVKQAMLRDMVVEELLSLKAREMGLRITDAELAWDIQNTPAFMRDGKFHQGTYFQILRYSLRMTPETYEESRRKILMTSKLKQLILLTAKLTPQELEEVVVKEASRVSDGKGKSQKPETTDKEKLLQDLQQQRALDILNQYLKQASQQVEIRSFLEQREKGL